MVQWPSLGPRPTPQYALPSPDLVALATVADVVPCKERNRALVKHGLKFEGESVARRAGAIEASWLFRQGDQSTPRGIRYGTAGSMSRRVGDAIDGLRPC